MKTQHVLWREQRGLPDVGMPHVLADLQGWQVKGKAQAENRRRSFDW